MQNDAKDTLILELVEILKVALKNERMWHEVALLYAKNRVEGLTLKSAEQNSQLFLDSLFGEYDKAVNRGLPAEGAVRVLLMKLRQSVR